MNKVTKEDKEILSKFSDNDLADMSNLLNCWEWPEELPNPEPDTYIPNDRRSQLMRYIDGKVGGKLVSRRWNKDRMTDEQHEIFWNSDSAKSIRGVK